MALAAPGHGIHETTQTSGILGPANAIALLGAVANRWAFSDQYASLDDIEIVVQDPTTGQYEYMIATFTAPSTLTPVATRLKSSDGGAAIEWSGSGTRDVMVSLRGAAIADIIDADAQTAGLLARTGTDTYEARTLQNSGDGYLTWTNPAGTAGNPTPDLSSLDTTFLNLTSGAALAARTMLGRLVLDATATVISGLAAGVHKLWGDDALTDQAGQFRRVGADDWRLDMSEGGTYKRVVAASDPVAGDAAKTVRVAAGGGGYEHGAKLPTPVGATVSGAALVVNSNGDGYAVANDLIAKKSSDDATRSDGAEYLIGELSNLTLPVTGDGNIRLLLEVFLEVDNVASDEFTMKVRMGTGGGLADASVWSKAFQATTTGRVQIRRKLILTIPNNATKLSITVQRTSGAASWTAKGLNEAGTLFDLTDSNTASGQIPNQDTGAYLHARVVGPA